MFRVWELSNVLFGDTIVPYIEEDHILLLGYVIIYIYIRNMILLGSTMKKRNSVECKGPAVEATFCS